MSEQDKVMTSNPEMQAQAFMWMNYGAFISKSLNSKEAAPGDWLEEFIEESVQLFARALTP